MVSITVTEENCDNIENIFHFLTDDCGIKSLKCTVVRDEGVYKTQEGKKRKFTMHTIGLQIR